ncbi:MAG: hypothetical protein LBE91_02715 [Tannerella sp.]|jgi:C-terminal processing protease CtpA/Prc|nr:hypothetical protein [Tannerella sp.]
MSILKKLSAILTLLFSTVPLFAQTQPYLWPIEGAKAGDNIISAPQSYIDGELNFCDLIIGAPEGTTVLSPVDGTVNAFMLGFLRSLTSSVSCIYEGDCIDEKIQNSNSTSIPGDTDYYSGLLGIRSKDGKMIWFRGLRGKEKLKTGQAVRRGDPIGKVAYSYFKIKEPSILISIDIGGKPSDPMTPFGIKSSFVPPGKLKPVVSLSQKQAKEDFLIYINVLKDAYPGLYDVVTKEELDGYVRQTVASIENGPGNLTIAEFQAIIRGALAKIHDSHIYSLTLSGNPESKQSSTLKRCIDFGWINDTLVCTNAAIAYSHLINRQIKSVNGMSADSIKRKAMTTATTYDAHVEYQNYHLAFASDFCPGLDTDLDIEFADGETIQLKGVDKATPFSYSLSFFNRINSHLEGYWANRINKSTAYIGLSTFNLNQVQVEKIGNFIRSINDVPNLIIDVRNNGGGEGEVIDKLYSYIAGDTLILNSYSKVNKRSGYESFKYSLNRTVDDDIFNDYVAEEGKEGFYLRPENASIKVANPEINYKGRVYILINERSASAAALFPAMLVRNQRGVVVGRETRTAFHFMNAVKFVEIRLPNSMTVINIPLVQNVFDTVVNERTPYGRGVLPDYPVPITIDELSYKNGDAILNYTLNLIENREYSKSAETESSNMSSLWKALIVAVVLILAYLLYRYYANRNNSRKN